MLDDDQIYIVVDIETNGPVAGLYSMLSLAAVATTRDQEISTFYQKLIPLANASQSQSTMDWWKTQPEAWKEVTTDAQSPDKVMFNFAQWVDALNLQPVFVSHPVSFDYSIVSWYLWKFLDRNPFADSNGATLALDLSSYISGRFGLSFNSSKRPRLPVWMTKGMPDHSHNALDDAQGYAVILRNVLTTSGDSAPSSHNK